MFGSRTRARPTKPILSVNDVNSRTRLHWLAAAPYLNLSTRTINSKSFNCNEL